MNTTFHIGTVKGDLISDDKLKERIEKLEAALKKIKVICERSIIGEHDQIDINNIYYPVLKEE